MGKHSDTRQPGETYTRAAALPRAGSVPVGNIAKWNGAAWSALGEGLDGTVHTLAFDSQNNLYAGGCFENDTDYMIAGVAKWDGSRWNTTTFQDSGETTEDTCVYAMVIDSNDNMYVGGQYSLLRPL